MESDHLDVPQIAVVGVQGDFNPSSIHILSLSFGASRTPPSLSIHVTLIPDNHVSLSSSIPILRSARNSLDPLGPPVSYTVDTSLRQPPPSPTHFSHSLGAIHFATTSTPSRDKCREDYDISSFFSLLAPPSPSHCRMGSIGTVSSIGSTSAECDIEDSSNFRLRLVFYTHSDATSTLPSPTHTHEDAGADVTSHFLPQNSFSGRGLYRVRWTSPYTSRETTHTGSETLRSDGQRTQQAYSDVWDLKNAADLDGHESEPSNDNHVNIPSWLKSPQETLNDPCVGYGFSPEALDHVQLSTADQQSVNVLAPLVQDVPTSLPTYSRILTSPDKLYPTLSSWLKNMNEFSGLIDRLQELGSSSPAKYRSQLSRQVATLCATFKKQQERYIEILELSEEYATRYLFDISTEIQQQSLLLDMLGKRLDMAKTLHGHAIYLRRSRESGIVNTMKDVSATGKTASRLQRTNTETYDLQHYRSRFQRTLTYSAKWTLCYLRFSNVTWN